MNESPSGLARSSTQHLSLPWKLFLIGNDPSPTPARNIRSCLKTFLTIVPGRCYWHLEGRGQGYSKQPTMSDAAQNVHSDRVEMATAGYHFIQAVRGNFSSSRVRLAPDYFARMWYLESWESVSMNKRALFSSFIMPTLAKSSILHIHSQVPSISSSSWSCK